MNDEYYPLEDFGIDDLEPAGDPEDGGIVYSPVDIRDCFSFAEFAERMFYHTRPRPDDDNSAPGMDAELVGKMARRYAVQALGWEARNLEWKTIPGTAPVHMVHELEGTEHRLHYRPHARTGDYELLLERYCRFHRSTDFLPVHSLAELGALLAGEDVVR